MGTSATLRCLAIAALSLILFSRCNCGGGRPKANPPPPPTDLALPTGYDGLPTDDAGRPIMLSAPMEGFPDISVRLVYDRNLDNPLVRRGECLARVLGCYDTNPGPISDCITQYVEKCADDTGGMACCAPGCIALYKSLHDRGQSEDDALEEAFVTASCLKGFADFMDGGRP